MKITKYGHSCLVVEEQGVKIAIDPGNYTEKSADFNNIKAVLISHAHQDHCDVDRLRTILAKNPGIKVITRQEISDELAKEKIDCQILGDKEEAMIDSLSVKAYRNDHEPIYPGISAGVNTAYLINNSFFYPGDSYLEPEGEVEILALPVSGPWVRLSESIDYGLRVKPTACFPVHDGNLLSRGAVYRLPEQVLGQAGTKFATIEIGQEYDF